MPIEIIELKEIYRGFIALRLATLRRADAARVRCEAQVTFLLTTFAVFATVTGIKRHPAVRGHVGENRVKPHAHRPTRRCLQPV